MSKFKVGDRVRVISDCKSVGKFGVIAAYGDYSYHVKVLLDGQRKAYTFNEASLYRIFSKNDYNSAEFGEVDDTEDFEEISDFKNHNNIESKWKLVFSSGIQDLMTNFVTELVDDVVIFDFSFKTVVENDKVQYVVEIEGIGANNAKRVTELFAKVEME